MATHFENANRYSIALRKGLFSSIIIFVCGFVAMNVFWVFYTKIPAQLGLYDFRAATIGDGIFLPLLVGSGFAYITLGKPLSKKASIISVIVGVVFALIAGLVQLSWLQNDYIRPNWTIPYAHHFTDAGWYHAAFFVFMFFIVGYLLSCMWFVHQKMEKSTPLLKTLQVLFWLANTCFLAMLYLDDYNAQYPYMPCFLYVLGGVLLVACIYYVSSNRHFFISDFSCLLSALITAFAFGILVNNATPGAYFLGIIFALFSTTYISPNIRMPSELLLNLIMIFIPALIYYSAISNIPNNLILLVIPVIIFSIISWQQQINVETCRLKQGHLRQVTVGTAMLIIGSIRFGLPDEDVSLVFAPFIGLIIGGLVKNYITSSFKTVVKIEDDNGEVKQAQRSFYILIGMFALGILFYLLEIFSRLIDSKYRSFIWTAHTWAWYDYTLLTAVVIISTAIYLLKVKIRQKIVIKVLAAVLTLATYSLLFILVLSLRQPFYLNLKTIDYVFGAVAILVSICSAIFSGLSFYNNQVSIRGGTPNRFIKILSFMIFLGSLSIIILTLFPPTEFNQIASPSIIRFITGISVILLTLNLFPIVLNTATPEMLPKQQIAKNTPIYGILQDNVLIGIMVILGGALPLYYCTISSGARLISGISELVLMVLWVVQFCLRNNVRHLRKREEEFGSSTDDTVKKQLLALWRYLRCQNILVIVALFAYWIIIFIIELASYIAGTNEYVDQSNVKLTFLQSLSAQYIPSLAPDTVKRLTSTEK